MVALIMTSNKMKKYRLSTYLRFKLFSRYRILLHTIVQLQFHRMPADARGIPNV